MRAFFMWTGIVSWSCTLAMIALSVRWERRDRKARDRERLEREQAAHIRRFASCRAAGTILLFTDKPRGRRHA